MKIVNIKHTGIMLNNCLFEQGLVINLTTHEKQHTKQLTVPLESKHCIYSAMFNRSYRTRTVFKHEVKQRFFL